MNKSFILLHITFVTILISVIFGLSFGIALPNNLNIYNNMETICVKIHSNVNSYNCCNKICNNSLPQCDDLIKLNESGKCHNSTNSKDAEICIIICENCTRITNTFEYNGHHLTNISIDCNTNQTCIEYYYDDYNVTCWYNKKNVKYVIFDEPPIVEWYIYYIISILCLLVISYIIIVLICAKYHDLFI